ncbi:ABC-2 family transporter protein, partial [Candidatus Uhrbacteria bacterium]|nr:ABC-2 family transporter protein [Candidatus Uhrbacteria bacterium]
NLAIVSMSFWTTELENAWWLYRDIAYVSRFPPEILPVVIRAVFIFIVPILVVVSFPTKALLGLLSGPLIIWAIVCTAIFLALALKIWGHAIKRYTSASS